MKRLNDVLYGPVAGVRLILAAFAIVPVLAALVLGALPVSVPDLSADPVLAIAAPAADAASLPVGDGNGGGADGCIPRVRKALAFVDVCWQVYRQLNEDDPRQDYYSLEITATAHGDPAAGMKWAVVRTRAHGLAPSSISEQATSEVDLPGGSCVKLDLKVSGSGPQRKVDACEHWQTGFRFPDGFTGTVWTCGRCLTGFVGNREVSLVELGVSPQGKLPSWDVGVDVGI
jgi:hypothetical protein